jgi:glycosyltransferase involved in cell wall biosynthesis
MRVAFLVHGLGLWGGVGVVVEHARRLRVDHDFDAQLVLAAAERTADWTHGGLVDVPVRELDQAREERWDVAIATWWETVFVLHHLPAARYAFFVQSMEERFYPPDDPARMAAVLTHDLPLGFITEARWIADQLRSRRREPRVFYVRNGIDKTVFTPVAAPPVPATDQPLRVLVEGNPAVTMKGVGDALAATHAMDEPHSVTLVSSDRQAARGAPADRVVGPLTQLEMAGEYAASDVVLKLSRVEGMFGPPLEGFHRGATCVVTPVTGYDEYVVDGFNGVVVNWDDVRGTARALDLLARDSAYLHLLRTNALATARAWPSSHQAGAMMALALQRIRHEPSPDPTGSAARLAADARVGMEVHAAQMRDYERLRARVGRIENALSKGPVLRTARKVVHRVLVGRPG